MSVHMFCQLDLSRQFYQLIVSPPSSAKPCRSDNAGGCGEKEILGMVPRERKEFVLVYLLIRMMTQVRDSQVEVKAILKVSFVAKYF